MSTDHWRLLRNCRTAQTPYKKKKKSVPSRYDDEIIFGHGSIKFEAGLLRLVERHFIETRFKKPARCIRILVEKK